MTRGTDPGISLRIVRTEELSLDEEGEEMGRA